MISISHTQSNGTIILMWDAVPGSDGYRIRRRGAGEDWRMLHEGLETSFADSGLLSGIVYTYNVIALNTSEVGYTAIRTSEFEDARVFGEKLLGLAGREKSEMRMDMLMGVVRFGQPEAAYRLLNAYSPEFLT